MTRRFLPLLVVSLAYASGSDNRAAAQVPPDKAEATFKVVDGLQLTLWASEETAAKPRRRDPNDPNSPTVIDSTWANPTCMDVDHKGRVWVCESVNYRNKLHGKKLNRPEGDRIVILEDTKGTGKADKATTFYQSPELYGPLGIAVAKDPVGPGYKVFVCQSPDILVFEDKEGDGKADGPPKKLLTGFGGFDHDHGVHGILIGPDMKLYFSVGDQGVAGPAIGRRQGPQVDQQRHRLPGRHHLALRPRRQEPGTDRPQLPQRIRAVRRQLRHHLRLRQRRRRQPADAHLLRHARRQLRLPPARPGPDPLARGAARRRAEDAAHLLRLADRHVRLRGHAAARRSTGASCCTPTPARATSAATTSSRKGAGYDVEREDMVTSTRQLVPALATCAWPRTAACSSPTGTTPASAATAWATGRAAGFIG